MTFEKNKVLILLSSVFIMLSMFFVSSEILFKQNKRINISKIIQSKAYAYLPDEAKDYVTSVYQETGTILLTEKNKEKNIPYLNSKYVNYLSLAETEKKEADLIPEETIIDYVTPKESKIVENTNNELPSKYDLRNVNGKNFVTPIKNQGGLGLCWAFATIAQAESYLLVNSDTSCGENAEIFSERQIDYATADDGIIDGKTLYNNNRFLGDGGNFNMANTVMLDNLGLVDVSWKNYDSSDFSPMEFSDVYKFNNSKYGVDSTINMPLLDISLLDLTDSDDMALRTNYLNALKETIIANGGLYVGTGDPTGYCSYSINGSQFLYDDGICNSAGHAMQIIGWDDSLEYSFCSGKVNSRNFHYIDPDITNCSSENIVSGTGAWLVKNSWGSDYSYIYLAYDSKSNDYNAITKLATNNWDNSYGDSTKNEFYLASNSYKTFSKKSVNNEKINKIKIGIGNQNKTFKLYVGQNKDTAVLVDTITSNLPGIYTFDLLEKNIIVTGSSFYVRIVSDDGGLFSSSNTILVYTNNVDSISQISTYDIEYKPYLSSVDDFYKIRIESDVVDIAEDEIITYRILDSNREEITSDYTISENVVSANKVYGKIIISGDLKLGTYIIQSIYNNEVLCESKLLINKSYIITNGIGTYEEPYLITTAAQLDLIRTDVFAYYKLMSDIDLTYDTNNSNGMFYNNGLGWEPIRYKNYSYIGFSGGFDGNNHKIIGLYINRPNENNVGFFSILYNTNFANMYVKDLTFENANVKGRNYVGVLNGHSNGTTNERCLTLNNIAIINSSVHGINYVGGISGKLSIGTLLEGYCVEQGKLRHQISNLYSNTVVSADNYAGGIFGLATTLTYNNSPGVISNLLSNSNVTANSNSSELIGSIDLKQNNSLAISNAISLGSSNYGLIGGFTNSLNEKLVLTNMYYLNNTGIIQNDNILTNNIVKKNRNEIKQISNYSSWIGFSDNWSVATINNILRYPMLKFIAFEHTTIPDINISMEENNINIYDLITPNYESAKNIDYEIEDTSIASIDDDGVITGLNPGRTVIHIISYYDGYEKEVPLIVTGRVKSTISFNSNEGSTVNSILGYAGDEITEPMSPIRIGYIFGGWYTDNGTFKNKYVFTTIPENDLTIYAKWNLINYTITYDADGGINSNNGTITYNIESTSITLPTNPKKDNYDFKGWKLIACEDNWSENTVYTANISLNKNYGNIILKAYGEKY